MTSEERRTLMVIEHRLCSDDPGLAAVFAQFEGRRRLGGGRGLSPARAVGERRGWRRSAVPAALLWVAAFGLLLAGAAFAVGPAVMAGMLLFPVALWASLSRQVSPAWRAGSPIAGGARRTLDRR